MLTENLKAVSVQIANIIKDSTPANVRITAWGNRTLESIITGECTRNDGIHVELVSDSDDHERRTNATLYVNFERPCDYASTIVTDEEGNVWMRKSVNVQVNWPTHGSAPTAVCEHRLAFYAAVVGVAKAIETAVGNTVISTLLQTKEEKALAEQRKAQVKLQRELEDYLRECPDRKNMRVGSVRTVCSPNVQDGRYGVTVDRKEYVILVDGSNSQLERVA